MEGLFFYFILLGVFAALLNWITSPRVKGQFGEFKVRRLLSKSLNDARYTVLNDVTLNTSRGTTQIDHIIVSAYGIFVIETKNMSGWIFGSESSANWTQTIYRKKSRFQNPLRQNFAHIKALQELLGLDSRQFHSIVVFAGDAEFKTHLPANVMNIGGLLPHIQIRTTHLIDDDQLPELVRAIETGRLVPGAETDAAHIDSLRARHGSIAGAVDDARGLIRQGVKTLGLFQLAGKLLVILVFVIIANQSFKAIGAGFSWAGPGKPAVVDSNDTQGGVPQQSVNQAAAKSTQLLPFSSAAQERLAQQRREQEAKNRQKAIKQHLAWKASLMCGYSTDTMKCACYDPKAGKVPMEFEECKALADKGTGIVRR